MGSWLLVVGVVVWGLPHRLDCVVVGCVENPSRMSPAF